MTRPSSAVVAPRGRTPPGAIPVLHRLPATGEIAQRDRESWTSVTRALALSTVLSFGYSTRTTGPPTLAARVQGILGQAVDTGGANHAYAVASLGAGALDGANTPSEAIIQVIPVTTAEVAAWRGSTPLTNFPPPQGPVVQLQPSSDAEIPRDPIEQVILRRGSSRKFDRTPITLGQLSTMLDRATRGVPADFHDPVGSQLNHLYLIVHAVEDLEPGAYVFHRGRKALECLKQGDFRSQAGYLGLQQALPADAAVDVFFLANLGPIVQRFGNRGYRALQLEAGILGGKLYLAAYTQHLGATGLTFFDDEVTSFFSPHATGKSAIFLVALGHSTRHKP